MVGPRIFLKFPDREKSGGYWMKVNGNDGNFTLSFLICQNRWQSFEEQKLHSLPDKESETLIVKNGLYGKVKV